MGAVHPPVPGFPILHTTPDVAGALNQIRPEHRQSSAGRPLLPVL